MGSYGQTISHFHCFNWFQLNICETINSIGIWFEKKKNHSRATELFSDQYYCDTLIVCECLVTIQLYPPFGYQSKWIWMNEWARDRSIVMLIIEIHWLRSHYYSFECRRFDDSQWYIVSTTDTNHKISRELHPTTTAFVHLVTILATVSRTFFYV